MTGNSCLLDTSIIIHSFKDNKIAEQLDEFINVYVPSIAAGELFFGAYRSANVKKHIEQIHLFLQKCIIVNPNGETADAYGNIKAKLKDKGKPIPENDIWIAAIAIHNKLPLFTSDKHFKEVDGLKFI